MKTFSTAIVETRELSTTLRSIVGILLIISAYFLFIDQRDWSKVFLNILRFLYFGGLMLGFGLPFIKPRHKGIFALDEQRIVYEVGEEKRELELSRIKEIHLDYKGYGSWWSHTIYGNKNFLEIITLKGEKLDFEILIKNREEKQLLKRLLTVPRQDFKFISTSSATKSF